MLTSLQAYQRRRDDGVHDAPILPTGSKGRVRMRRKRRWAIPAAAALVVVLVVADTVQAGNLADVVWGGRSASSSMSADVDASSESMDSPAAQAPKADDIESHDLPGATLGTPSGQIYEVFSNGGEPVSVPEDARGQELDAVTMTARDGQTRIAMLCGWSETFDSSSFLPEDISENIPEGSFLVQIENSTELYVVIPRQVSE